MVSPQKLLLMGKVIRPHGLGGLLRISSHAESEDSFLQAGVLFLRSDSGDCVEYGVVSAKRHGSHVLIRLQGLDTVDQAEKCRGADVLVRKDALAREKDEYFWHELIGLQVYIHAGRFIGTIRQIIPTGSNDIYVVEDGKTEVLIPATQEAVKEIDLENNTMIISEMEGLLDSHEV
ncbi:MAG: 16S rRNA processing protein RimM [Deltaproteobacteria bacterium]|nr:16S rRNA processing protein RimM [Deltaproteobacteria bacterium]